MKKVFIPVILLLLAIPSFSQYLLPLDSARKLIQSGKTQEEKFYGMRRLDRYYYTTGYYDSSATLQKEMYAIANALKKDSFLYVVFRAIGNRYTTRSDYNFGLENYFNALKYVTVDSIKAGLYQNIAYVYAVTQNNEVAKGYVQKGEVLGVKNHFFQNLLYGLVYNNLNNPDSALFYLKRADENDTRNFDPSVYAILPTQIGKAYELKGDSVLAEAYYKKALAYCRKEMIASAQIRHGNVYCDFLLNSGKYKEAKEIALENIAVAQKTAINEGISNIAEVLKKIYTHSGNKDSIIYYAQLQIDYKDSVSNQKRLSEFQNMTFAQQLRDIDEQTKSRLDAEQRNQNIQYALIALGIIIFIILFLLLSRGVITNVKVIRFLSIVALLIVFEFLNLFLHPFLERITHHSPLLMLLALVCIAALLVPLHHRLEKSATHKLVEKNKKIRLAVAKKTIERLGE
jgi:hypothetical protein